MTSNAHPPAEAAAEQHGHTPLSRAALFTVAGAVLVALALGSFALTQPADSYLLFTGFLLFLFMTQSLAWNLIGGYGGQTSFGHATFYGIGAYTTALLQENAGWPPLPAVLAGAVGASIFSVIWGYPLFRLRGFYFAIATIGIGEATRLIALNPLRDLTGGASGFRLSTEAGSGRVEQFLTALGLALVTFLLLYWIRNSKLGLGLFALNMDSDAAETLGVDTTRLKAIALALSAFIVGLTGGVYVRAFLYINPNDVFAFSISIAMVLMAVIGGVGTLVGPILGAVVYVVIQDQLGAAQLTFRGQTFQFRDVQLGLYGLLLALIILFEPAGLVGLFNRIGGLFRRRPPGQALAEQQALLRDETGGE
jgi:branched-chain amino acid transport system permease protein